MPMCMYGILIGSTTDYDFYYFCLRFLCSLCFFSDLIAWAFDTIDLRCLAIIACHVGLYVTFSYCMFVF